MANNDASFFPTLFTIVLHRYMRDYGVYSVIYSSTPKHKILVSRMSHFSPETSTIYYKNVNYTWKRLN